MHNFAAGGASPDEATALRRIDRFYHVELRHEAGQTWAVFSVSGDAFLRGQVHFLGIFTPHSLELIRHMVFLTVGSTHDRVSALSLSWLAPRSLHQRCDVPVRGACCSRARKGTI